MPGLMQGKIDEAMRKVCTPLNGSAFPLTSLAVGKTEGGTRTQLRDSWAANHAVLASASDLVRDGPGRLFSTLPKISTKGKPLIRLHRDAAARMMFSYLRSHPESREFSTDPQQKMDFQLSMVLPFNCTTAKACYKALALIGYAEDHHAARISQVAKRFQCSEDEAGPLALLINANLAMASTKIPELFHFHHILLISNGLTFESRLKLR